MTKQTRNYGIDLLRLLAMFMVVMIHVIGSGGILDQSIDLTLKGELVWLLRISCYSAVNCYALISGYVGFRAKHRYSNIIILWLGVVFWGIVSAILESFFSLKNGGSFRLGVFVFALSPVTHGAYWYFTAYVCLFFFIPFLNEILHQMQKKWLARLLFTSIVIFMVWGGLFFINSFGLYGGYSFTWLAVLYMLGGYCAKYQVLQKISIARGLIGFVLCIIFLVSTKLLLGLSSYILNDGVINNADRFISYTNFVVVLAAICLLSVFEKIHFNEKAKKIIAVFSPAAFGVYIIHCSPFFNNFLISNKFAVFAYYTTPLTLLLIFLASIVIFTMCIVLELCRIQLFRVLHIKDFATWIEKVFRKFFRFFPIMSDTLDSTSEQSSEDEQQTSEQ